MTLEDVVASLRSVENESPIHDLVEDIVSLIRNENVVELVSHPYAPGLPRKSVRELLVILKTREKIKDKQGLPLSGMRESVTNLCTLSENMEVRLALLYVGERACSVWFDEADRVIACVIGEPTGKSDEVSSRSAAIYNP